MRFNDQKKLYRQNALIQSDILYLPDSRGLDVTGVSGKCADIIRSIYGSMSRLAPMGDDEREVFGLKSRTRGGCGIDCRYQPTRIAIISISPETLMTIMYFVTRKIVIPAIVSMRKNSSEYSQKSRSMFPDSLTTSCLRPNSIIRMLRNI